MEIQYWWTMFFLLVLRHIMNQECIKFTLMISLSSNRVSLDFQKISSIKSHLKDLKKLKYWQGWCQQTVYQVFNSKVVRGQDSECGSSFMVLKALCVPLQIAISQCQSRRNQKSVLLILNVLQALAKVGQILGISWMWRLIFKLRPWSTE